MRITLESLGQPGSPFHVPRRIVEVPDEPSPAGSGSFRPRSDEILPTPPPSLTVAPDPLGAGTPSGDYSFAKIALAPIEKDFFDGSSTGAPAIKLAPLSEGDDIFGSTSDPESEEGTFVKAGSRLPADGLLYRSPGGFEIRKQTMVVNGRQRIVITSPNARVVA